MQVNESQSSGQGQSQGESCSKAAAAAHNILMKHCQGSGRLVELKDGAFALVPEDEAKKADEIKAKLSNDPPSGKQDQNGSMGERAQAIQDCVHAKWAHDWAVTIVGEDAPEDVINKTAKHACEGLYGLA